MPEEARQTNDEDARLKYQSDLKRLRRARDGIRKKIDDYRRDLDGLSDD